MYRVGSLEFVKRTAVKNGQIVILWSCPRCYKEQESIVPVEQLVAEGFFDIWCKNVDVCGRYNSRFTINLSISDLDCQDHGDIPLATKM